MRVQVTKRAERRIEIVDSFWRKNRLDAPNLFKEELAAAEARLSEDPYAGKACVINGKHQELVVVWTVWGARRGRDPRL